MLAKLKAWLPTLLSKKLGVLILAFVAEVQSRPHQTPKQMAIAIVTAAYILGQGYVDAHK